MGNITENKSKKQNKTKQEKKTNDPTVKGNSQSSKTLNILKLDLNKVSYWVAHLPDSQALLYFELIFL